MHGFQLNTNLLNAGGVPLTVTQDDFVFDGYSLNNGTTRRVQNSNHDDLGTIEMDTYDAPRIDGGGVIGRYHRTRDIRITMTLSADSVSNLNDAIDELKKNLLGIEGNLDIKVNGEIRRRKATVPSGGIIFNRQYFHITFVQPIQLVFRCIDPHAFALSNEYSTIETVTGDVTEEITNIGTVDTEGRIYIIFGTGNANITGMDIDINGYTLNITQTLSDGHVLYINGETNDKKKGVYLNNTAIDYTGRLPEFGVGSNIVDFTFNGSSPTIDCTISTIYKKKYR